ncbi:MAG: response regulator transcription factor [Phycisphaeraceae bacterium]|nr:response regulator transcription factor [Phycisphaeraceae bacterium]
MAPRSKAKEKTRIDRGKSRARAPDAGAIPLSSARARPAGSRPIRVLCVDDHLVLIEGLKARFSMEGGINVVGQLMSAERLLQEVGSLRPDVVTLDIEMPGPDAFEMADRLKREFPQVCVVVLSAHIRDAFISASFRSGVSAYFAKSDELSDIVRGIYEVAHRKAKTFLLGPKVSERCRPIHGKLVQGVVSRDNARHDTPDETPTTLTDSLTPRELEILRLIGKGLSRTQIAAQLCRSTKTVDAHQGRMMRKLGIDARADLMRFAIREGLAQA